MISYTPPRDTAMNAMAARLAAVGDVDQALDATPQPFGSLPVVQQMTPTSQSPANAAGIAPNATAQGQVGFANHVGGPPPCPIPVADQPGNPVPQPPGEGARQPLAGGRWTRAGA